MLEVAISIGLDRSVTTSLYLSGDLAWGAGYGEDEKRLHWARRRPNSPF